MQQDYDIIALTHGGEPEVISDRYMNIEFEVPPYLANSLERALDLLGLGVKILPDGRKLIMERADARF